MGSKAAYVNKDEEINGEIKAGHKDFGIVMVDMNDLKRINDTEGHQAGDHYIRDACGVICNTFKHSPVFRVGGDEFVVVAQGVDYAHIDERVRDVDAHNEEALRRGTVVIACGVAAYEGDDSVASVFERADHLMYEDKTRLKSEPVG